MYIYKRSGEKVPFDGTKIEIAVRKANTEVSEKDRLENIELSELVSDVQESISNGSISSVEEIQDYLLVWMNEWNYHALHDVYSDYREKREKIRNSSNTTDSSILDLIGGLNEEVQKENSNKDPVLNSTQRDLIAGEVSKDITRRKKLPRDIIKAHDDGLIHFHDMDYFIQPMYNCCLVNLEDMLQNGTVINGNMIERPKSFQTACTVATQIVAQVASAQYGGQTISLAHLAPFVNVSREKHHKSLLKELDLMGLSGLPLYKQEEIVEERVKKEISDGVQTIQYQLETLSSTNGQSPFVTVHMDFNEADASVHKDLALVIEEVLKQRIKGVKNEKGVYVAPAFPKLTYVLDEGINAKKNDPYYYLTILSAECSARRLVPDYISAKKMREYKEGNIYPPMGCRSFLTPWQNDSGEYKFYGRFNQGVTTINIVDAALSSGGDIEKFWTIMDERMDLIRRAQLIRYEHLKGTTSDVAPILWQYGGIARLEKGEKIDKLLNGGYSTTSIGFAGLYEAVKFLTGESHTSEKGHGLGMQIMQYLNDKAEEWKKEYEIDFSVYGSPIESATYRFARLLKRRFGVIEGITDRGYITNSYHIHVTEKIDAFSKLSFESEFQELAPGGAISYVEVPNMQKNIDAMLAIIDHIYENIQYAEINTKADYCMECGFSGEILINDDLEWYCPECGNKDQDQMQVTRRTCGYIGSHFWNEGRTQEIAERELHIGRD